MKRLLFVAEPILLTVAAGLFTALTLRVMEAL